MDLLYSLHKPSGQALTFPVISRYCPRNFCHAARSSIVTMESSGSTIWKLRVSVSVSEVVTLFAVTETVYVSPTFPETGKKFIFPCTPSRQRGDTLPLPHTNEAPFMVQLKFDNPVSSIFNPMISFFITRQRDRSRESVSQIGPPAGSVTRILSLMSVVPAL